MNQSLELSELYAALAKARMEFGVAARTNTAKIRGKSKSGESFEYSYKYSPLEACFEAIDAALGSNGLCLSGGVEYDSEGAMIVLTRLGHASGQWIENGLKMGHPENVREMGSMLTYGRRLGVCLTVQLQAEDDDDGEQSGERAPAKSTQTRRQDTASPFVPSAPTPAASTAAAAPMMPSVSEPPPSKTRLIAGEELNEALKFEFKRLAGGDQQMACDLARSVFGSVVDSWKKIDQLHPGSKRNGLKKLQAMQPQHPPTEEDVPMHDPPPDGPQEGPQRPPGSTQESNGPIRTQASAVVSPDATGEADRGLYATGGDHSTTGQLDPSGEVDEPSDNPQMTSDNFVDPGDVRIMALWAAMTDQEEVWFVMTEGRAVVDGTPVLSLPAYRAIKNMIKRGIGVNA